MKKSFTLIELMVTISIIGILVSVAVPSYDKYILKGRFDEAVVSIKSIVLAMENYKIETGRYYPYNYKSQNNIMYNGDEIKDKLKVDLSSSNNFLYGIEYIDNDGQEYKIYAILRKDNDWGNDRCDDNDNSTIMCVQSLQNPDHWTASYNRELDKHYIEYTFPNGSVDSINGIDYTNIYKE